MAEDIGSELVLGAPAEAVPKFLADSTAYFASNLDGSILISTQNYLSKQNDCFMRVVL